MHQDKLVLQRASRNAQAYPWMRRREDYSVLTFPRSTSFAALAAGASGTLPVLGSAQISPSEMPFPESAYRPSDLQPMVTNFSEQMEIPNLSLPAAPPVPPLPIQPPLISDDLMLEEIALQAKTGLFVLLGREKSLQ